MKTIIRTSLVPLTIVMAGSSGCSSIVTATASAVSSAGSAVAGLAKRVISPSSSESPASRAAPAGLDDYKTQVAQHVLQHNPERSYSGKLPPMLPAIVVLEITVDRDGQLADVEVQRSRDEDASKIALDSMRRSTPLPPPQQLAQAGGKLKFSETFLFADSSRYQLRSLAGPQTAD
jgi:protein TonB